MGPAHRKRRREGRNGKCAGRWCCSSPDPSSRQDPSRPRRSAHAHHGKARQVDRRAQKPDVGIDLGSPSDPSATTAMATTHEMSEFALNLRPGGAVVRSPVGVALSIPGPRQRRLVGAHSNGAPGGGVGALGAQGAGATGLEEAGQASAIAVAADRHRRSRGAGDRVVVEVDGEAIPTRVNFNRPRRAWQLAETGQFTAGSAELWTSFPAASPTPRR